MNRDPRLVNAPVVTSGLAKGNLVDTNLTILPNVVTLGTVTNVSVNNSSTTFTYGSDFDGFSDSGIYVWLGTVSPALDSALSALSPGDLITLGPWASTDGNNATLTFSSWNSGNREFTYSSSSANYFQYGMPSPGIDGMTLSSVITEVTTNNSSLVLGEAYFKIGDTKYTSADFSVASGTLTKGSDISSNVSVGDLVTETTYTSLPTLNAYDPTVGEYISSRIDSILYNYRYLESVLYESSGTFVKANYPDAKYLRVTAVGGGGGSAGCAATSTGQVSLSGGGGSGGVIVAWVDVSKLAPAVSVTIGAGGAAGTTSGNGGWGGESSFGDSNDLYIYGYGGDGSLFVAAGTPPRWSSWAAAAGFGSANYTGNVVTRIEAVSASGSGPGEQSYGISATMVYAGGGGGCYTGGRGAGVFSSTTAYAIRGTALAMSSGQFGGGGGGRAQGQNRSAVIGDSGQNGCVLVEVFG